MKQFLSILLSLLAFNGLADDTKPWTFWYWMNGAVSKEGITTDLKAMADVGLGGCYLMPIYGVDQAPELGGTIRQGSPEWWEMVDYSLKEADRLGLQIGMHICDGFALAGGPWISKGQSMRMVTSLDTIIHIGGKELPLCSRLLPATKNEDFKDIAAYAIPLQYQPASTTLQPHIASDNPEFTIDKNGRIKCSSACTFTYTYDEPITVSALEITTYNNSLQALRMKVNGHQLTPPRHGWQNYDQPTTVSLPTITTQKLTFEWTPEGSEKGSEDLDNGKWGKTLKIQEMKVLATPRIDDWEGKSGRIWRVSSIEQDLTSQEMYIPLDEVIRLTPETILPTGDWRIVRIGHISTNHTNATGGDCKGLECDKFSRSAIQSQLNHWFEEAFRQCDPTVARRVLKYMHVDSWECGSQNWSDSIIIIRNEELGISNEELGMSLRACPRDTSIARLSNGVVSFAEYFAQKRGYDLLPYLPLMVGIPMQDRETSERVLRDIRNTIAQVVDETFFPTLAAKAKELDCQISAESMAPTMISDGMAHYRHVDFPMGEFWLNSKTHDKPNDMLDAISAGHIYGKKIIQAEGFTELRGSFDQTPAKLKPLLDKQFCLGMNRLFFHVFTHNPYTKRKPGMTLNGIGLFFQPTQPWWPEARSFVDYITRCQQYLQVGSPVVDLAVYTGHEMPRRAILPERLPDWNGYHYDSFNYDALINACHPFEYKALILPGPRKMDPDYQPLPEDAQKAIENLRASGVRIIEGTPTSDELKSMYILPDVIVPSNILFAHRNLDDGDFYFLSNQSGQPQSFDAQFRSKSSSAVLYDPVNATYQEIHSEMTSEGCTIRNISLPAYGSSFVFFGNNLLTDAKEYFHNSATISRLSPINGYRIEFAENGITLTSDTLPDWSKMDNDSIRYYSGRVCYSFDFKYKPEKKQKGQKKDSRIFLRFNDLHDVASVSLNGKPCSSVWTAPYEIEVTETIKKGKNHLEIWVANSWNNAIIGHDLGKEPFPIWTNAKYRSNNPQLQPAGLGQIEIIMREQAK